MNVKKALLEYSKLTDECRQLEEIIGRIAYRLEKPEIAIFVFSRTSTENICKMRNRLVELSEDYAEKLKSISESLSDTEKIISSLDDPLERIILRSRYIDALTWEDISEKTGYEWAQLHRLHKKALTALESRKVQ